ncbi:MAG: DNA translocase FtsK [Candidatus Wildermuthbacteria bacterium]|nr:DNA translocase FtsK [Candidatus Wildermuthbacteria bacterium]
MDSNEKINELKQQVEDLSEDIKKLGEKQNSQYTDIMLALKKIDEQTVAPQPDTRSEDELYEDAKEIVIEFQKASTSMLQRSLGVGYARAAGLMDMLEENGVISKGDGAKPRDVLIKEVE